jgi:hypothetical protein
MTTLASISASPARTQASSISACHSSIASFCPTRGVFGRFGAPGAIAAADRAGSNPRRGQGFVRLGKLALAGRANVLLATPDVTRSFLGG